MADVPPTRQPGAGQGRPRRRRKGSTGSRPRQQGVQARPRQADASRQGPQRAGEARPGPAGPETTGAAAPGRSAPVAAAPGGWEHDARVRVSANRHRVQVLCALFAAVPALVLGVALGAGVGVLAGVIAAVATWGGVVAVLVRRSASIALSVIGGRALGKDEDPTLANLVRGLCATVGVPVPDLWVVDDPVPNACTLAGRGGRSVLVVTSGLRSRLGLIELEGVVAHELVHLKCHDAIVSSVAVATAGQVARLTGTDGLVHLAVGRGREYRADQAAAVAVRYPPGLHDALAAIAADGVPGPGSVFSGRRFCATRWVWIDPMVGAAERTPLGELDATDVRVAALGEW